MKKNFCAALCGSAMLLLAACNQTGADKAGGADKAAEMKSKYTALNDAFNSGKTEIIDSLLTPDCVDHSMDTSWHLPQGPAGLKQMIADMRTTAPDLKNEIKHMAVDGDILIAYGTVTGTNTGPMMGMPATNKKWSSDFCDVVKFNNEMKMTDHWGVYDEMKMMKELGLMPSAPPPAAGKAGKADTVIVH